MKYECEVTITKNLVLDIPDKFLSDEAVNEYRECICKYTDDSDDLVRYTAKLIALYPDITFVEGVGKISYDPTGIQVLSDEIYEIDTSIKRI